MRLLRSDIIALFTGAAVIFAFSLLFYFDYTGKSGQGSGEVVGTISFKRKVAQRKYSSQVVWEELDQNVPVYNNDSIRTAEFSEAVIHLKDGTDITLDQNSMILLSMANNQLDIDFSQGSVSAKRDNVKGEGIKSINFTSGGNKVSIGKTSNVVLNKTGQKDLNLFVSKGVANINTAGGIKKVNANEKAVMTKGQKIEVTPALFKLEKPENSKYFITSKNKINVDFSWKILNNKGKIFFQSAAKGSFKNIIHNIPVSSERISLSLGRGMYYWRLKSIDGKKSSYSNTGRFSIVNNGPPSLNFPENNFKFYYRKHIPIIYFSWEKSSAPVEYTFILSDSSSFKNILKKSVIYKNSITLDSIKEGKYFWKVHKKVSVRGESNTITSSSNNFSIEKMKLLPSPAVIYPENNKKISRIFIQRKLLTFSWGKNREVTSSEIIISRNRNFSKIIDRAVLDVNSYNFKKLINKGSYF